MLNSKYLFSWLMFQINVGQCLHSCCLFADVSFFMGTDLLPKVYIPYNAVSEMLVLQNFYCLHAKHISIQIPSCLKICKISLPVCCLYTAIHRLSNFWWYIGQSFFATVQVIGHFFLSHYLLFSFSYYLNRKDAEDLNTCINLLYKSPL